MYFFYTYYIFLNFIAITKGLTNVIVWADDRYSLVC